MKNETKEVKAPKAPKAPKAAGGKTPAKEATPGQKHPESRQVVFKDVSCDYAFLSQSTLNSSETIKWEDGQTYPLIKVEISSASHPFFTGKQRVMDTEGRIDRFRKKYSKV